MSWGEWNDEAVDLACWLFAGVALAVAAAMVFGCSATRPSPVPADAGAECAACWQECGQATSRKQASMCSYECNRICESEGR